MVVIQQYPLILAYTRRTLSASSPHRTALSLSIGDPSIWKQFSRLFQPFSFAFQNFHPVEFKPLRIIKREKKKIHFLRTRTLSFQSFYFLCSRAKSQRNFITISSRFSLSKDLRRISHKFSIFSLLPEFFHLPKSEQSSVSLSRFFFSSLL